MRKVGRSVMDYPSYRFFCSNPSMSHFLEALGIGRVAVGTFPSTGLTNSFNTKPKLLGTDSSTIPNPRSALLPINLRPHYFSWSPSLPNMYLTVSPDKLHSAEFVLLTSFCRPLPIELVSVRIVASRACEEGSADKCGSDIHINLSKLSKMET